MATVSFSYNVQCAEWRDLCFKVERELEGGEYELGRAKLTGYGARIVKLYRPGLCEQKRIVHWLSRRPASYTRRNLFAELRYWRWPCSLGSMRLKIFCHDDFERAKYWLSS